MGKPAEKALSVCTLALLLLTLTSASTPAQSAMQSPNCTGVIKGTVSDAEGRPVQDLSVMAFPLGVDLGTMLPKATTNGAGNYNFVRICPGRYTVFPSDKNAGYPISSPDAFIFLYGKHLAEARLDVEKPVAYIDLVLPPKPGRLNLQIWNRATNSLVESFKVKITIPNQKTAPIMEIEFAPTLPEEVPQIAVPPNKDFYLQVTAKGLKKWNGDDEHRNPLQVPSGAEKRLHIELTPATQPVP